MNRYGLRYWMLVGLLALVGGVPLMAQDYRPELRVGVGGYYSPGGIGKPMAYQNDWVFYPKVIYASPIIQDHFYWKAGFGYRENQRYYQKGHRYSFESGEVTSFNVFACLEGKLNTKLVSYCYGIDLEYEQSNINGVLREDVYPFKKPIEYQKRSFIIQPYVGLRKVIWSQIVVFAETSFEVGFSNLKKIVSDYPFPESFAYTQYKPISEIGVGFILR